MGKILIGLDEVGWGCAAGPITVGAAHVPEEHWERVRAMGFRDSKVVGNEIKLNRRNPIIEGKCDRLARELNETEGLASWAIAQSDPLSIDLMTPREAKAKAFRTALVMLMHANGWEPEQVKVIVDGNQLIPNLPKAIEQEAIPKADDHVLPCSVASVVAKSYRDNQMRAVHQLYPKYGFESHKGYPTPEHLEALLRLGPIDGIHRFYYLKTWVTNHYQRKPKREQRDRQLPKWVQELNWIQ